MVNFINNEDGNVKSFEQFDDLGYADTSYNFCFVLYPDSHSYSYLDLFKNIKTLYFSHSIANYAYILHDCDIVVDSDIAEGRYSADQLGQPRKPHYHLLINFKSQKSYRSVLKLIGLYGCYQDENGYLHLKYPFNSSTAIVHNFRQYLKYMLHRTEDSAAKHRYDPDKMITSDPELINKATSDSVIVDDVAMFNDLVHFIDTSGIIDMREVYNFCSSMSPDYISLYFKPKFYRTIKDFVDNHNTSYKKRKDEKLLYDRSSK